MYEYIITFMSRTSSEKCWQQMFTLREKLQLQNILQLVEICLVIPISNAEVERVFSGFTKMMTRDRLSLKNESQEAILRVRGDRNFKPSRYDKAVTMFLNQYPNGEVRKRARRLDGHKFHRRRRAKKVLPVIVPLSDDDGKSDDDDCNQNPQQELVNLSDISSDESQWSESDSDDE
ncbi:uncharacterized protein LOC130623291 [Hydractinia symbiolongicarpus]|uniref:uncharacterized protein LOC130623291 n=1 Tax=Hydractinia symbiolongicarpus TaxID=13093 RepID=UPI0025510A57|nr:uncharacterized protein LOC130623291 [Hydractinia symbiolongicarpus]